MHTLPYLSDNETVDGVGAFWFSLVNLIFGEECKLKIAWWQEFGTKFVLSFKLNCINFFFLNRSNLVFSFLLSQSFISLSFYFNRSYLFLSQSFRYLSFPIVHISFFLNGSNLSFFLIRSIFFFPAFYFSVYLIISFLY